MDKKNIDALEHSVELLCAVLCDPNGKASITGTQEDNAIIDRSLLHIREAIAELRAHKEQVRCGGCRKGQRMTRSNGDECVWCPIIETHCDLNWYCADAEAANG